jgi:D-alanyl-D-alanine carboxypeptidase
VSAPRRRPPLILLVGALVAAIAAIAVARAAIGPATEAPPAPVATRGPMPGPTIGDRPPTCRFGDREALDESYDDWRSTILDTTFRLPRSYVPPDLVSVARAGFPGPQTARSFVMPDLAKLREAADEAGHPIDMIWGYRSFSTQTSVFEHSVAINGTQHALSHAARPGHSEHQLGTVFDFKTEGAADVYKTWESEPTGRWMAANAWRFGFVMSYPRGQEDETCYGYEPWHYRYLGRPLAAAVHDSGETTREYLWTHRPGA